MAEFVTQFAEMALQTGNYFVAILLTVMPYAVALAGALVVVSLSVKVLRRVIGI